MGKVVFSTPFDPSDEVSVEYCSGLVEPEERRWYTLSEIASRILPNEELGTCVDRIQKEDDSKVG